MLAEQQQGQTVARPDTTVSISRRFPVVLVATEPGEQKQNLFLTLTKCFVTKPNQTESTSWRKELLVSNMILVIGLVCLLAA